MQDVFFFFLFSFLAWSLAVTTTLIILGPHDSTYSGAGLLD